MQPTKLTVHIKEHLDEIDAESLKNGHKEFECSLCKSTSNDEESVKNHLINHVLNLRRNLQGQLRQSKNRS